MDSTAGLGRRAVKVNLIKQSFYIGCALAKPTDVFNVQRRGRIVAADDDVEAEEWGEAEDNGCLAPWHIVSAEDPAEGLAPAPPLVVVCHRAPVARVKVVVDETVVFVKGKGAVVEADAMLLGRTMSQVGSQPHTRPLSLLGGGLKVNRRHGVKW